MAAAHHRLNYIHPFPDGNGRVSRLMSHAMALKAGIGAPWPVVGVARSRPGPRQPPGIQDLDGPCGYAASGRSGWARQPLAQRTCRLHALFLKVCLDQVTFMGELFDLDNLDARLARHVERSDRLKPEAARLLREALVRAGSIAARHPA